jgi:hypothetical protein
MILSMLSSLYAVKLSNQNQAESAKISAEVAEMNNITENIAGMVSDSISSTNESANYFSKSLGQKE